MGVKIKETMSDSKFSDGLRPFTIGDLFEVIEVLCDVYDVDEHKLSRLNDTACKYARKIYNKIDNSYDDVHEKTIVYTMMSISLAGTALLNIKKLISNDIKIMLDWLCDEEDD